jgi:DNA-binding NtrC family response regulator
VYNEADAMLRALNGAEHLDMLILDWQMGDGKNDEHFLELLAEIRSAKHALPILSLTCATDLQQLLLTARMGAGEILLKPFSRDDIREAVQRSLDGADVSLPDSDFRDIPLADNISFVRNCKKMREVERQCTLVARADIPVLVLGESGTGKEVAAMLIHKLSAREGRAFLKVNCAAMPADLLESELFGYEQGAFTGAVKAKPGKFELCNHGTILLDEIGEMPTQLQAKLLQVLQDGSFSRLGGRSNIKVNVRVVAATNINIKAAVAQKTFREDLYYRLNGFTLHMPPLRERKEEIPVLAKHFMRKIAAKFGCEELRISPALLQALERYDWPGNLREMENIIKRYVVLKDEFIIISDLHPPQAERAQEQAEECSDVNAGLKRLVRNVKGDAESAAIKQTLEEKAWNRKAAASELQISYKALLYKIKQYRIDPPPRAMAMREDMRA